MSPFVVVILLVSTFMHAGWNLLARRQRSEAAFFLRMLAVTALIGAAPAIAGELVTKSLPATAWWCLLGSGVCCGAYYFFLSRAYGSSDFTTVYPVARALPVLLVGAADVFLRRNPTAWGWSGMALVVLGCFLTPLKSLRGATAKHYLNRAILWVTLTAFGTVGYTLFDKAAAEVIVGGPAVAARYGYFFFVAALAFFMLFLLLFGRRANWTDSAVGWRTPALGAVFNFGAYWLVLWAYQLSERASYIVAFRQFSIVIAVVLAFVIYKEHGRAVRLAGTFLITVGLLLIGLWGG